LEKAFPNVCGNCGAKIYTGFGITKCPKCNKPWKEVPEVKKAEDLSSHFAGASGKPNEYTQSKKPTMEQYAEKQGIRLPKGTEQARIKKEKTSVTGIKPRYVPGPVIEAKLKEIRRRKPLSKSINEFVEKQSRIYLKPGEMPPEGVQTQRGKEGGLYYIPIPKIKQQKQVPVSSVSIRSENFQSSHGRKPSGGEGHKNWGFKIGNEEEWFDGPYSVAAQAAKKLASIRGEYSISVLP